MPQAVFCLLTALAFHRLTTQVPHAVEVALPRTARVPRLDHVWKMPVTRPTRDIDLLGRVSNNLESVREVIATICQFPTEGDGMFFDPETVATERIAEDADYEGVRAKVSASLGNTRLPMQIDIGFSDIITPESVAIVYPAILGHPAPEFPAYNRETVIAEKFEATVKLGELNSRMKDFFDI